MVPNGEQKVVFWPFLKGHLISKAIYGLLTSSKKTNGFDLILMKIKKANKSNSSVRFLEEARRP